MTEEQAQEINAVREPGLELTVEQMFSRLNEMTAQRDKLNTAISAFKKSIQRRVGRL